MSVESKCPFTGVSHKHTVAGAKGNRDWWPDQLNLSILSLHSPKTNPMGEEFKSAQEFKTLVSDYIDRRYGQGARDAAE